MPEESPARRVLVVTDEPELREEMAYGFPAGVSVSFAESSREALQTMQDDVPDLVVSAIRTGNSGGFSLALEMNQRIATQGVPMVLLLNRAQDEWLAKQGGAVATLVAPFSSAEVVDLVMHTLSTTSS